MTPQPTRRAAKGRFLLLAATLLAALPIAVTAVASDDGALDPAHNLSLPCEAVSTPGLVPRSAKNIVHLANVCGFVGTDIEFQSRTDAAGDAHDYAFVGTMGAGTRIFDVTDPAHPTLAGGYVDPGWQNDVQVRGDTLVIGFDWLLVGANVSECLEQKNIERGSIEEGGVDIVRLDFDPQTATFETHLAGCYVSTISTGGAHTMTLHPSGEWLSVDTSFAGIEVVDLRSDEPTLVRYIPPAVADDAHDVSFSANGTRLYSAGIGSTRIVDVTDIFNRDATLVATVPNAPTPAQGADGQTIQISHQSDTSSDGSVLVVTDEAGGGLSERRCNQGPSGKIGAAHFWALAEIAGVPNSAGGARAARARSGPGCTRTLGCSSTHSIRRWRRSAGRSGRARSTSSATAATARRGPARSRPASTASRVSRRTSSSPPTTARASGTSTSAARRRPRTARRKTSGRRGGTRSAGT